MNQDHYINLIHKHLSGDILPKEQQDLAQWKEQSTDNQLLADSIHKTWKASGGFKTQPKIDLEADFKALQNKLDPPTNVKQLQPRRDWLSIAAGFLLLLTAGYLVNKYLIKEENMLQLATLADDTQSIELADGSKVVLNENSTLHYPEQFSGKQRLVYLEGEAYFDVAKNPQQAFVITTKKGAVRVLGTTFNVKDRQEEGSMLVSVRSGKVEVTDHDTGQTLQLEANEKALLENGGLEKITGNTINDLAWYSEQLVFASQPLKEVITTLQTFYKLDIDIVETNLLDCTFSGNFDAKNSEQILNAIVEIFDMQLEKVTNNHFRLTGGRCE